MSKGKRRERQARDIYEAAGYETFAPQESKFGPTDMFGLFDFLAVPTGEGAYGPSHLAQVKSNQTRGIAAWMQEARRFHKRRGLVVRYLICYDGEGWRVDAPNDDSSTYTTVVDEREEDAKMGEPYTEYLRR